MNTLTNSQRLDRKLALVLPVLMAPGQRLLNHPHVRALCPEGMATVSWINRDQPHLRSADGDGRGARP